MTLLVEVVRGEEVMGSVLQIGGEDRGRQEVTDIGRERQRMGARCREQQRAAKSSSGAGSSCMAHQIIGER